MNLTAKAEGATVHEGDSFAQLACATRKAKTITPSLQQHPPPPPPYRVAVVAAAVHPLAVGQERHARAGPGAVVEPVRAHPQQPQQRLPRAPSVTTRPRPPRTSLRPGPAQRSLPAGIALGPHTPPSGPHPKQPRQALSGYRGPALGPVRH